MAAAIDIGIIDDATAAGGMSITASGLRHVADPAVVKVP